VRQIAGRAGATLTCARIARNSRFGRSGFNLRLWHKADITFASRIALEEESRRKAEAEARERAEKDRVRKKKEAQHRKEEELEQAFATAKHADSISAIDTFLATHPETRYTDEAQTLRAALVERDDAFKVAVAATTRLRLNRFSTATRRVL